MNSSVAPRQNSMHACGVHSEEQKRKKYIPLSTNKSKSDQDSPILNVSSFLTETHKEKAYEGWMNERMDG